MGHCERTDVHSPGYRMFVVLHSRRDKRGHNDVRRHDTGCRYFPVPGSKKYTCYRIVETVYRANDNRHPEW